MALEGVKMGGPLNPEAMELAALSTAQGERSNAIVARLKISPRTMVRWKKRPDFKARVNELRTEILRTAVDRCSSLSAEAAIVLGNLLRSPNEMVRLSAARSLLQATSSLFSTVQQAVEDGEARARLDALEKAAKK